jgi:hypothetical protein
MPIWRPAGSRAKIISMSAPVIVGRAEAPVLCVTINRPEKRVNQAQGEQRLAVSRLPPGRDEAGLFESTRAASASEDASAGPRALLVNRKPIWTGKYAFLNSQR